jgi:succinyl-CoA synthetase beta subunit
VGGGANVDQVTEAFRIILADKNVKAILVNIFGGIMKCDTIVTALLAAYDKIGITIPLVVRLEGTNVELARDMLAKSGKKITTAVDLTDAAKKVVATLGA